MNSVVQTILDSYNGACIAIKDGRILRFNHSASILWPSICPGLSLSALGFPELPPDGGEASVSLPVERGGRIALHIAETEGVFLLLAEASPEVATALDILSSACSYMREPLSNLSMAAGLLFPRVEAQEDKKLASYMSIIYQSYYKLLRAVGHIALLQEATAGVARAERKNIDVAALCKSVVDSTNHFTEHRSIEFTSKCESIVAGVNGGQIERMLLNLLANSLKYTPKDGKIRVSLSATDENLIIEVSDTGCGIDEDKLDSIFKGYAVKRDGYAPGSGLQMGLSVVQRIASMHGGTAVLTSKKGEGTTVKVSIPRRLVEKEMVLDTIEQYETNSVSAIYTELSDVIPYQRYSALYMD